MTILQLNHLSLSYADKPVIVDLDLTVKAGDWIALLGRSGCGKSTLLKVIAGLSSDITQSGQLLLHTQKIAYMAQQDALLPWLSVVDNVQLSQRLNKTKNQQTTRQAEQLLAQVGLSEQMGKRPYELSGGQRQRVALARTLMQDTEMVLIDEAFSAVDAITRLELQQLTAKLLVNKTVIFITHDPVEAIRLADKIYVLYDGRLSQALLPNGKRPRFDAHAAQPDLQQQLLNALMQ